MIWLAIKAFMGRAVTGALTFLGSLNAWQILCLCCLALAGLQTLKLHAELRHSAKVEKQLTEAVNHSRQLQAALDALAAESKQQQTEVEKVVDHYITVTKPGLIREREKIVHAPLPGQCKTPQEVLNADI